MTVAIHTFLNIAGGSFSAVPSAGFGLRREISFRILFPCGELFPSGQNGSAEAFLSRNKGVTNANHLGYRSTTLDGTGIGTTRWLVSAEKIWLFNCN